MPPMRTRSGLVLLSDGIVDLHGRRIVRRGVEHPLTRIEARLLEALAETPGEYFSVGYLLEHVWDQKYHLDRDDREQLGPIRNTVSRLRRKTEADPDHPLNLRNEPDVGYALVPAVFERAAIGEACAALMLGEPVVLQGGWGMGTSWSARRVQDWWVEAGGRVAATFDLRNESDPERLRHADRLFSGLVQPGTTPGLVLVDHVERARRYGGTNAVDDALCHLMHRDIPATAGWRLLIVDRPTLAGSSGSVSFRLPAARISLAPMVPAALARLVGCPASEGPKIAEWTGGSPGWALELARWKTDAGTWADAAADLVSSRSGLAARFRRMFTGALLAAAERLVLSGPSTLPPESLQALAWLSVVAEPPDLAEARLARLIVERLVRERL